MWSSASVFLLIIVVAINALTAFLAWQTWKQAAMTERNTNSMKDALVAATAKASHAEGMEAQRDKTETEAKDA
jgi:hypothetical protein